MGILDGIRILEWGAWHVIPSAASMLGEMGAEVIKLEEPGRGDPSRGLQTIKGVPITLAKGRQLTTELMNPNKKSLTVNTKTQEGQEIVHKLIKKCDVFMHNYPQTTADKLGLDYETLTHHNPQLIYLTANGFGSKGPDKDLLAMDPVGQARGGLMDMARAGTNSPPVWVGEGTVDEATATNVVCAVLAALLARERLGIAQHVEVSMLASTMGLLRVNVGSVLLMDETFPRQERTKMANPLANHYQCQDGKWIMFTHMQADRYWHDFCEVIDIKELEHDARFVDMKSRAQNCEELISILDQIFAAKTSEEWLGILHRNKGRLIFSPVNTPRDVASDPQVLANEYVEDFEHPVLGNVKMQTFPAKFSKTPTRIRSEAPELGQHVEEILLDLGYSWEDILKFKDCQAI